MADVFTKRKRSQVMSLIRGHGNKATEIALATIFKKNKITGWRRHQKLIGRPDFVFRQAKLAVFVDGCFWHGCPKHGKFPKSNKEFWNKKLVGNKHRDQMVSRELRLRGWAVVRVWECSLTVKKQKRIITRLRKILA